LFFFLLDITKSCDYVFWAGDLNFRIDMTHQEVLDYCEKLNYNDILLKDEFRILQKKIGKEKKNNQEIENLFHGFLYR